MASSNQPPSPGEEGNPRPTPPDQAARETTPHAAAEQPTARATAPHDAPTIPRDILADRFQLERWLGSGAYGEVWLARDLSPLGRWVALKFLRVRDQARREQALATLHTDARVLGSLHHPNIVQVYDWVETAQGPCLVLQYVSGGTLGSRVSNQGPLAWAVAGRYVADVADGLSRVHGHGVIHRDVKPENILQEPETDEAVLTDFGIAARLTDPSSIAGTPRYMAPEAFLGQVSPALDVYSLAATLFWLVTGQPPFGGETRRELLHNIERGLPRPDPRCAGLPAGLEQLIRAGLSVRPSERPTLADFTGRLRGSLNLLLADALTLPFEEVAPPTRPTVRLLVTRADDTPVTVARAEPERSGAGEPEQVLRDLRWVPRPPERVVLQTGDRVRLEVEADQPGHVTVFNVGPTGKLNLLHPAEVGMAAPLLPAHTRLYLADAELTLPAGRERVVAVWTRRPWTLRLEELHSLLDQNEVPGAGAYRATRDMVRVQQSLQQLGPEDRQVVVLELDHV
jgi:hypothetical protein